MSLILHHAQVFWTWIVKYIFSLTSTCKCTRNTMLNPYLLMHLHIHCTYIIPSHIEKTLKWPSCIWNMVYHKSLWITIMYILLIWIHKCRPTYSRQKYFIGLFCPGGFFLTFWVGHVTVPPSPCGLCLYLYKCDFLPLGKGI